MEIEKVGILTSVATTKRGTFISFISGAIKRDSYLIKVDDNLMNDVNALVGEHVRIEYKEDNDNKKILTAVERFRWDTWSRCIDLINTKKVDPARNWKFWDVTF